MSVDEAARHRFYNRAVVVFGEEEATILMAHLPPGGWSNLATKQDLLDLEQRLWGELGKLRGELRGEFGSLESRLKAHTLRTVLTANLSLTAVFTGIVAALRVV